MLRASYLAGLVLFRFCRGNSLVDYLRKIRQIASLLVMRAERPRCGQAVLLPGFLSLATPASTRGTPALSCPVRFSESGSSPSWADLEIRKIESAKILLFERALEFGDGIRHLLKINVIGRSRAPLLGRRLLWRNIFRFVAFFDRHLLTVQKHSVHHIRTMLIFCGIARNATY